MRHFGKNYSPFEKKLCAISEKMYNLNMQNNKKYLNRICDETIKDYLKASGAVIIKGPKWCGKSTTAKRFANSEIYMQDEANKDILKLEAKRNPAEFLNKKPPLLIDEWQEIPFIWNSIRYEIDKRNKKGQFILTGSTIPTDNSFKNHSGIGRINEFMMRTMSLYESLESTGDISLAKLFNGIKLDNFILNNTPLEDIAYYVCRGGWPESILCEDRKISLLTSNLYYKSLVNSDFGFTNKNYNNNDLIKALLKSYSRNIGSQVSFKTISDDINSSIGIKYSEKLIKKYLDKLKELFIIEESNAWLPNLRSNTVIRTSSTKYFLDQSIGISALGISPNDLLQDLNTFGLYFENMCIRDLRIYAEKIGGTIHHYRDKNNFEIDTIIHLDNGKWALIEIKLNDDMEIIKKAVDKIKKFASLVIDKYNSLPSFIMILTAGTKAYQFDDNVYVVPITTLKD